MPSKKYIVSLNEVEKNKLTELVRKGKHSARTLVRARVLLLTHVGQTDRDIGLVLGLAPLTPRDIRKRYVEGGLDRALFDAPRPGQPEVLTPEQKAKITAIACTNPPEGYARWTLDLLEERVAKNIKRIGRTTIHRILLANDLQPWREKNVVHSND